MKRILLLITVIALVSCNNNRGFSNEEIKSAKFKSSLDQISKDADDLKKYLDWENDMKLLCYQLHYSDVKAQKVIDSLHMRIYSKNYLPEQWYIDLRRSRDSSFILPDSLINN